MSKNLRQGPAKSQLATAAQLRALLESYADRNDPRFLSIATQIAAHVARAGNEDLAESLRAIVTKAKRLNTACSVDDTPIPISRPTGDLAGLLAVSYSKTRIADMVLPASTSSRLNRVVREYRNSEQLEQHGLSPRRKLLLVGHPGCGKSMTAAAIAGELGRPLLQVQLHALIAKFMGETAAKLHLVFEAMTKTPGVYLFDEFDALGASRTSDGDVGEARRILNSFLVFLEQDQSRSIIVAATNIPGMLDHALFRRFDDLVEYSVPGPDMIEPLIRNRLSLFNTGSLSWKKVILAAQGLSHDEIVRASEDAAKDAVLGGGERILTAPLVEALELRSERGDKY